MASEDGKNVVHMAAWQGCMENLVYLVEELGCNVNVVATGPYSYGKTPIFFAATRSRNSVVEYLLQRGAQVRIVNNKGQSVLSIASSHLEPSIVAKIQQQEEEQEQQQQESSLSTIPWRNYRSTHSDGLEYGDLDPRFLERPLRPTDVVTRFAVNPTTKQSRRGSFLRRNPHLTNHNDGAAESSSQRRRRRQQAKRNKKKEQKRLLSSLSKEETLERESAWEELEKVLVLLPQQQESPAAAMVGQEDKVNECLTTIVRLSDKERRSWLPETAKRLQEMVGDDDDDNNNNNNNNNQLEMILNSAIEQSSGRVQSLLTKLHDWVFLASPRGGETEDSSSSRQPNGASSLKQTKKPSLALLLSKQPLWSRAYECVRGLTFASSLGTNPINGTLSLPQSPVWVDSVDAFVEMEKALSDAALVALDTEWYTKRRRRRTTTTDDNDDGTMVGLATLQCATTVVERGSTPPNTIVVKAWVIDLLQESIRPLVRHWIRTSLFAGRRTALLGFAFQHDLSKLQDFVEEEDEEENDNEASPSLLLRDDCLLDLQTLATATVFCRQKLLPGLQTCCARYADRPLSKEEQCSSWECRPLTESQLHYAGLDAAVLLVLLAELYPSAVAAEENS